MEDDEARPSGLVEIMRFRFRSEEDVENSGAITVIKLVT